MQAKSKNNALRNKCNTSKYEGVPCIPVGLAIKGRSILLSASESLNRAELPCYNSIVANPCIFISIFKMFSFKLLLQGFQTPLH